MEAELAQEAEMAASRRNETTAIQQELATLDQQIQSEEVNRITAIRAVQDELNILLEKEKQLLAEIGQLSQTKAELTVQKAQFEGQSAKR